MDEKRCTLALSDLIELADKDSQWQIANNQRIRADKFTAGKYADYVAARFSDVKASHFRTARTNAARIRAGESNYVLTPCFTLRAFITYLFTVDGKYEWKNVRRYITNKLPEMVSLLEAKRTDIPIDPVIPALSTPIQEWEPREGGIGKHIVRVGQYVEMLEKNHKTDIENLMAEHEQVKKEKDAEKQEYLSLLDRMISALTEMESMRGTGNKEAEAELQKSIAELKQTIDFYKKK